MPLITGLRIAAQGVAHPAAGSAEYESALGVRQPWAHTHCIQPLSNLPPPRV